jgi:nuclease S1
VRRVVLASSVLAAAVGASAAPAFAWGDEGHRIIGLIADHFLEPQVRARVESILAGDASHLTGKDIADECTWADEYRDSDRNASRKHYLETHDWHFVDLELHDPDLASACHGQLGRPGPMVASHGPSRDCVVNKIDQFAAELAEPATSKTERLRALQFLLHFVGDVHQPLHASDDHDKGGNDRQVSASGMAPGNLHRYWDAEFVERLGTTPPTVAKRLIGTITEAGREKWSRGTPSEWAIETFHVAERHVYGPLPTPAAAGRSTLTPAYVRNAVEVTGEQLKKAGVRLAFLLNASLRHSESTQ